MKTLSSPVTLRSLYKIDFSGIYQVKDLVAKEVRVELIVNEQPCFSLYASPTNLKELVIGFLYNADFVKEDLVIREMKISNNNENEIRVYVSLDTASKEQRFITLNRFKEPLLDFKISKDKIFELYRKFQQKTKLFKLTGCFHSACLCSKDEIIFFTEDIGRHNTVDKTIGFALSNHLPLEDKILMISGRITSEMVYKLARWKIPLVVSKGAATSLAIELAEKNHLTLIGFLRGERFNVYSHPERIIT